MLSVKRMESMEDSFLQEKSLEIMIGMCLTQRLNSKVQFKVWSEQHPVEPFYSLYTKLKVLKGYLRILSQQDKQDLQIIKAHQSEVTQLQKLVGKGLIDGQLLRQEQMEGAILLDLMRKEEAIHR